MGGRRLQRGVLGCSALLLALAVVVASRSDKPPPAMDPAYAKLSAEDKALLEKQADDSYFTGDMSAKEKEFARHQGGQQEMFGLNDQDKGLALDQSRVVLDKDGAETVKYLTTEDSVSDQDLAGRADVQRTAAANAEKLKAQLAAMQRSAGPTRVQQKHLQSTMDAIDDSIYGEEQESTELGEGADVSAQDPDMMEQIQKAKQKAQVEMDAVNDRNEKQVQAFKETMQESVAKANEARMAAVQKAQGIVPGALREYDRGQSEMRDKSRKKSIDLRDTAEEEYRKLEARTLADKQSASLKYTSAINKLTGKQGQVHMDAESWYEKKLAAIEDTKTKGNAEARQYLVKRKSELDQDAAKQKEDTAANIRQTKQKFALMMSEITERTKKEIGRLTKSSSESVAAAERRFKVEQAKNGKSISSISMNHNSVTKQTELLMSESRDDISKAGQEKEKIMQAQMEFKQDEIGRKQKMKANFGKIEHEANKFDLGVEQEKKEVDEKEKVRDRAEAKKGDMSEEEYKQRQMEWLESVKKTATQNCDDAKKESILRTRGSRIATLRLSRMSKDMLYMKEKVLEDIKTKDKSAIDMKEKAGKHLKKVVADQAEAMKAAPGSYDASKVQEAAVEYSKIAGPEKSQEERIREATEKVEEAKKSAKEHTEDWAKKQNIKTAENLKATADKVCHKEQHKYETVKYRVRKRLGTASETDHKALMKGQFEDKKWALRQVSVMLGKEQKITEAGEKKKVQLSQEEQKDEMAAERKEKAKINGYTEKATKFQEASKRKTNMANREQKTEDASQQVKTSEAEKLLAVSENAYKTEARNAKVKLDEAKKTMNKEAHKQKLLLEKRREQALEVLQKNTVGDSHKDGYERAQKKSEEMLAKAHEGNGELIEKVTKKRDEQISEIDTKTTEKKGEVKSKLQQSKEDADTRMAKGKSVLTRKSTQAEVIAKEANTAQKGARTAAEYAAQGEADKALKLARDKEQAAIKQAKDTFASKVKQASDSQVTEIKQIKDNILSSFEPPVRRDLDTEELIQLEEMSDDQEHEMHAGDAQIAIDRILEVHRRSWLDMMTVVLDHVKRRR